MVDSMKDVEAPRDHVSKACGACLKIVKHLENELVTKEMRTAREVEIYLRDMCEDLEGWYPQDVLLW